MPVLRSRLHPEVAAPQAAVAMGLAPLLPWVAAWMALAAVLALLGQDLTPVWWSGVAGAVAFGAAARFLLDRRVVEVAVDGPDAAVRTLWATLRGLPAPPPTRVLDARRGAPFVTLALGRRVFELDERDWADPAGLVGALSDARAHAAALPLDVPEG